MNLIILSLLLVTYVSLGWTTPLLGSKECTWGPTHWCKNLTLASNCHAVKHCIQTVWVHQKVEPDNDSICQICVKMVTQARDQLQSNETQEELKEVFEGSCKLIPVKVISKDCCKLADEFIPELVETLASEMDPQVVCSVAGLCNSARIDKLLAKQKEIEETTTVISLENDINVNKKLNCDSCYNIADMISKNLQALSEDQLLEVLLRKCGEFGSFSDGCANIIFTYFTPIYEHVQKDLSSDAICHMSGLCAERYHRHESMESTVEIMPLSTIGFQTIKNDDLPCELCAQLVGHLRDLLVANTTEEEFKRVLEGFCKQSKSFKDECLGIVDSYFPMIYEFLSKELDGKQVCSMAGLCPSPGVKLEEVPIRPLLPVQTIQKVSEEKLKKPKQKLEISFGDTLLRPEESQLPIERIIPQIVTDMKLRNSDVCAICDYVLTIVEGQLKDNATVEEIKKLLNGACSYMPNANAKQCNDFLNAYEDKIIDELSKGTYTAEVCYKIKVCPENKAQTIDNMQLPIERVMPKTITTVQNKESCTLCEYALHYIQVELSSSKTEEEIKTTVKTICNKLPNSIHDQCEDFISTYGDAVIALLVQEIDPSVICPKLGLCPVKKDIDVLVYGTYENKENCPLCLFAVQQLEEMVKQEKTEENIEKALDSLCAHLPKNLVGQCDDFVETYSKELIEMLIADLNPQEVCVYLKLCDPKGPNIESEEKSILTDFEGGHWGEVLTNEIPDDTVGGQTLVNAEVTKKSEIQEDPVCVLCEFVMSQIEHELKDKHNEDEIKKAVLGVCKLLPKTVRNDCNNFINQYSDMIIKLLISALEPAEICSMMNLCHNQMDAMKQQITQCAVCQHSVEAFAQLKQNPNVDKNVNHILKKSCTAVPVPYTEECHDLIEFYGKTINNLVSHNHDSREICKSIGLCGKISAVEKKVKRQVGGNRCTWGPAYWCDSLGNAHECGALQHCQERVWKKAQP